MYALTYRVIADIINTHDTYTEIAKRWQLSRQRVHQIACKMQDVGIQFSARLPDSEAGTPVAEGQL